MFSSWWQRNDGDASGSGGGTGAGIVLGDPDERAGNQVLGAGFFRLHKGNLKNAKTSVSVFHCAADGSGNDLDVAQRGLKTLKTLRHPSVVTFVNAISETASVTIATEPVVPLLFHLSSLPDDVTDDYRSWGVAQVFRSVGFLHEAGLVHACLHSGCVFVTPGLDWKLFGFEMTRRSSEVGGPPSFPPNLYAYSPPDRQCTPKSDVWGLGTIIWEIFNGRLNSRSQLSKLGKIPDKLSSTYVTLVAKGPSDRPDPAETLSRLKKPGGYLDNDLVNVTMFLEEHMIKDEAEKGRFFSSLTKKLDRFPKDLCANKILPELIKMFDFGSAGSQILPPVLKIGRTLSAERYQEMVVPCLVKLFASSDRNARYKLLCQLENFAEHLSDKLVNEQVFPQIQNGFMDQQPVIREKTVIAITHLAPKLTFANLDECVVMKHFSRLLRDDQPGIRTNTTVCLGKVARHLHHQTRRKVLAAAFGGKLKDPFPPARIAAVNGFAATQQYYTVQETSSRVLPMLCGLMTDPEKPVRDQAFKVARGFIQKLEQVSDDPSLKEEMEVMVNKNHASTSTMVSSWASWAVGAIGAKFYKSSIKSQSVPETASSDAPSNDAPETDLSDRFRDQMRPLKPTPVGAMKLDGIEPDNSDWNDDMDDDDAWESLETPSTNNWGKAKSVSNNQTSDWDDWGTDKLSITKTEHEKKKEGKAKGLTRKKEDTDAWDSPKTPVPKNWEKAKPNQTSDWDDWGADELTITKTEEDEKKREREAKRLARKKEVEAKRTARKSAVKLGSRLS